MSQAAPERTVRVKALEVAASASTPQRPVYVVGGAVRDMLLNRQVHDLDFVVPGRTRALAKVFADQLDGALYVLDETRDTTRVVVPLQDRRRMMIDLASLRAGNLEGDLYDRDFTVNAMAFDAAQPDRLIDPTGGVSDLREKRLRACTPDSFKNDPVRVLRLVRQAISLHFHILPETLALARVAAPLVANVSAERLRDEIFRMLESRDAQLGIRLLDQVGVLETVLPELQALKGANQTAPHFQNAWEHTLSTLQYLDQLYAPLVGEYDRESVTDLTVGSAVLWLGRYRQKLEEHYVRQLVPDRSLRALLFFAALYHDIAKPETRFETPGGRARFFDHPRLGGEITANRARQLALSSAETDRLARIVTHHMRVHFLANDLVGKEEKQPSRRAIYRFFKDTGPAGVDIVLLSLADLRGTYGVTLPQEVWQAELQASRALLEAYWEKNGEVVSPPRLVSGEDIVKTLHVFPGPQVGQLLSAVQEAQAAGEVGTREEALELARQLLAQQSAGPEPKFEEGEE